MSPTIYGVKQMGKKEPTKFVCIFCDFQTNMKQVCHISNSCSGQQKN